MQVRDQQKQKQQKLSQLSGKEFDKAYMQYMLKEHKKDAGLRLVVWAGRERLMEPPSGSAVKTDIRSLAKTTLEQGARRSADLSVAMKSWSRCVCLLRRFSRLTLNTLPHLVHNSSAGDAPITLLYTFRFCV